MEAVPLAASTRLDAVFLALADPTRRAILARLAQGDASVAELAAPFAISQPAISKHLKILERAGLISVGQAGQRRPRRLRPEPLAEASAWLERYREIWEASFERLDVLLDELEREAAEKGAGDAPRARAAAGNLSGRAKARAQRERSGRSSEPRRNSRREKRQ